jgi:hypothetical protein
MGIKQDSMNNYYTRFGCMLLAMVGLTACSSGGGGGVTTTAFTSWGAVTAGSTIVATGDSQQGTYTWNSGTGKITGVSIAPQQSGATFTETFDSSGVVKSVRFQTASGTNITFTQGVDTFGYLNINSYFWAIVSPNLLNQNYAIMADPGQIGWNYQSFGVWTTGAGSGSGTFGAASVGSATPAGSIPTSGSATYNGYAGGRHVASDGTYYYTLASMTTSANFATRQLSFATPYTEQTGDFVTSATNSSLNMTGTLSYAPGSNQFSGSISTDGGMTGTATGRFYGPSAQEIGGTFSATGAGLQSYGGAFGGKR